MEMENNLEIWHILALYIVVLLRDNDDIVFSPMSEYLPEAAIDAFWLVHIHLFSELLFIFDSKWMGKFNL